MLNGSKFLVYTSKHPLDISNVKGFKCCVPYLPLKFEVRKIQNTNLQKNERY